jgi:hypothetical protein
LFGTQGDLPDMNQFKMESMNLVSKDFIPWNFNEDELSIEGGQLKLWHDELGKWVNKDWHHFVPNDIPF